MKITLSLDSEKFEQKPQKMDAALISSRIASCPVSITFNDFVSALRSGQTYAPATFKNETRKSSKFIQQQVFVADIDDRNLSLADIQELCSTFDLPVSIIHESFSSSNEQHKWRIIFISDSAVSDPVDALAILRKIKTHFDSDPCTVDLARLLYSTTAEKVHVAEPNFFKYKSLDLEDFHKAPAKINGQKAIDRLPDNSKRTTKAKHLLNIAIRRIMICQDSRYQAVWQATRMLTQSKYFSYDAIKYEIEKAAHTSRTFDLKGWDKNLNDVIDSAIKWGMAHTWDDD